MIFGMFISFWLFVLLDSGLKDSGRGYLFLKVSQVSTQKVSLQSMAAMNKSPPLEVPKSGLAEFETLASKQQADPLCENVQPTSPVWSCVSMKSDHSMNPPLKFQKESSSIPSVQPTSPVSSCVSMKSNNSMDPPLKFQEESSSIPSMPPTSPVWSCVSMKSNNSMNPPLKFQKESSSIPSVQPTSPVSSCVSMKSNNSMDPPLKFQEESSSIPSIPPTSPVWSCVSMKSDHSMNPPLKFQKESSSIPSVQPTSPLWSCVSMKSARSMNSPLKFQGGSSSFPRLQPTSPESCCMSMKSNNSMEPPLKFQEQSSSISRHYPSSFRTIQQERSQTSAPSCASVKSDWSMDLPDSLNKSSRHRVQPTSTLSSCVSMKSDNSMNPPLKFHEELSSRCSEFPDKEICMKLKSSLKNRFQQLHDGLQRYGNSTLLTEIYTELYITEGGSGEVNNEHEVRQIETASRLYQLADDKPIKCNDIFKPIQEHKKIRTVMTKGVAGIGKTVSVQKFILDWAEGIANQDVHFIFPLPFRELNLVKDQHFSLEDLVHYFFPELKEIRFTNVTNYNIVFIFDGLDEHRFLLDFQNSMIVSEANIPTSIDVLLTNLIKGNLLPAALIWITTRPAAASQIPYEWISQVTEIRGFNDPQKEEYLRKYIRDETLANDVINHLKLSRSLYIMCHIPVFCWISATVLEKMLKEAEGKAIPKTLTQMYTHFLIIQTCIRKKKYNETQQRDEIEMIVKLGELAFKQLIKGNLIFYEEDLKECSINVRDAVLHSGVCTRIIKKDSELLFNKGNVYCFVHLSIQEHLAALYVHVTFSNGNKTVLTQWSLKKCAISFPCPSLTDLHKSAVDKTLQCKSGEFDLFLRFLLGISLESNQTLLQELLPQISPCGSQSVQDTIEYIKIRLRINLNPEKFINLFHCLNELNDFSLEEEIQNLQKSRLLAKTKLSPSQWAALVFVLLTSGNALDVFDLRKYSMDKTDECLQRMLPVVMVSRTAEVRNCNLVNKGFQALASALSSKSSCLRELKLSGNVLHQSGIQIISEGLQCPHCKLEILELSDCQIQAEDWISLFSALDSNPSHLRHLDLSFNPLREAGTSHLSKVLKNPHCRLETLKLFSCEINSQSCAYLATGLKNNSSLIELDLSKNMLKPYGARCLSEFLRNPSCKVKVLSLADCGITGAGCWVLSNALNANPSHLRELSLNRNEITDEGVECISNFLREHFCMLEKLSLSFCSVTESGCIALALALKLNPSHLRELEFTGNKPGISGQEKLKALQQHRDYRLEKLKSARTVSTSAAIFRAGMEGDTHGRGGCTLKNSCGTQWEQKE
ncbi:NACHT, LRR and PYD domains-containing protein 12 isoform X2 [Silurus asotus]|uniref:NACHT, LRR and PYD domains-containing protein 12 isoform X2 n=1 Tax=Silurus asotus TaxID=30991 RepID=A0AAD5B547_SILAS|nr:NACHT, LRR and PYD domains-containing protein 12 isoform X2 [Silurus asotus]